jgi:hypothetical protein
MVVLNKARSTVVKAFVLSVALGGQVVAQTAQVPSAQPAVAPAPLPDTTSLLKDVLANLDKVEAAREDYTATKTEVHREMDGNGRVKKSVEKTFQTFYLSGRRVEKLVAENGQPLSAVASAKEEARIAEIIRKNEERKRSGKAEADRLKREAERRESKDEPTAERILRLCRFVNGHRETFRGREVLAYDFESRPDVKGEGRVDSWIQKVVGKVWIDEAARQLLRLEARLTDSLKVAGGLFASVHKGSTMALEQELVRGEIWLPTLGEVNMSARFLLVKGLRTSQTTRFTDYRKFGVETSSEMKPVK